MLVSTSRPRSSLQAGLDLLDGRVKERDAQVCPDCMPVIGQAATVFRFDYAPRATTTRRDP
eukprot:4684013-Prymnesium_polylepis.1